MFDTSINLTTVISLVLLGGGIGRVLLSLRDDVRDTKKDVGDLKINVQYCTDTLGDHSDALTQMGWRRMQNRGLDRRRESQHDGNRE